MALFSSIIYTISFLALCSGFLFYRKSEKTLSSVTWVFLTYVLNMCFNTLTSGILTLVHIPVTILSLAVVNLGVASFFWVKIVKTKEKQAYKFEAADLFMVGFLLGFVFVYWGKMYGTAMKPAFYVPDGSAHYMEAMRVVRDRNVTDMYYHSINNAVWIELTKPFIQAPHHYKAYLFSELVNLFLSGISLYALIRHYAKDTLLNVLSVVFPLVYVIGYPLNNTLYGFVYLGEGITIIAAILLILELFCKEEIDRNLGIALLCLGCTGIALCYVLFAPVIFVAIFIRILFYQKKNDKVVCLNTVWINLAVFLIPCVLAIVFAYGGIFATTEETVGGSIAAEGTIYRDLYSNFLPWLPFAGYGFYTLIKQKKNKSITLISSLFLLQTIAFFAAAYVGLVSTYYFYKMHYLMWLFVFALAFMGLSLIPKVARPFPVAALVCWALVFATFITNADGKASLHNPYLSEPKAAGFFNNLYNHNLIIVAADPGSIYCTKYEKDKLALLDSAYYYLEDHPEIGNEDFMAVTPWSDSYWAISVLDMESEYFKWWPTPIDFVNKDYKKRMEKADVLLVFTDSDGYREYGDVVSEGYNMLYSNNQGFLLRKQQ